MSSDEEEVVTLRHYDNEIEAQHDSALLESEGIASTLVGLHHRWTATVQLRVLHRDAERAAQLLRSIGRH